MSDRRGETSALSQGQLAKALKLLGVPDPTPPAMPAAERQAHLLAHIHAWSRLLMTDAEHGASMTPEKRAASHIDAERAATRISGSDDASMAMLFTSLAHRVFWVIESLQGIALEEGLDPVTELALGSLEGVLRLLEGLRSVHDAAVRGDEAPQMNVAFVAKGLHSLAAAYDRFHEHVEPRPEPSPGPNSD